MGTERSTASGWLGGTDGRVEWALDGVVVTKSDEFLALAIIMSDGATKAAHRIFSFSLEALSSRPWVEQPNRAQCESSMSESSSQCGVYDSIRAVSWKLAWNG